MKSYKNQNLIFKTVLSILIFILVPETTKANSIDINPDLVSLPLNLTNYLVLSDSDLSEDAEIEKIKALFTSSAPTTTPPLKDTTRHFGWMKATFTNSTDKEYRRAIFLTDSSTDVVRFHVVIKSVDGSEIHRKFESGNKSKTSKRQFAVPLNANIFHVKPGASTDVYIYTGIEKNGYYSVLLDSAQGVLKYLVSETAVMFAYSGILITMIIFQLFLYRTYRDPVHLIYISFAFVLFLGSMTTLGYTSVLTGGDLNAFTLTFHFRIILSIFGVLLPIYILESKKRTPKIFKYSMINIYLITVIWIIGIIFPGIHKTIVSNLTTLLSVTNTMFIVIWAIFRGSGLAKIFMSGWFIFMASAIIWTLKVEGLIVSTLFVELIVIYGSTLEIFIFAYAVSIKVKLNEAERVLVGKKALETDKLRKLLRIVTHDISNPLYMISGASQTIRDNDTEKAWKYVDLGTKMIGDIVDHVRTIEAFKSGKIPMQLHQVSIKAILKDISNIFETKLEEKNIKLSLDLPEENICCIAEKTSLTHDVISNFVSNSIKFTPPGKSVTIKLSKEKDYAILTISDQGIGIPKTMLNVLFDPDARISRAGTNKEKGTGFGMAISKNYIDSYGGKIEVVSSEEQGSSGTSITVFLKLCPKTRGS